MSTLEDNGFTLGSPCLTIFFLRILELGRHAGSLVGSKARVKLVGKLLRFVRALHMSFLCTTSSGGKMGVWLD